MQSIQQMIIDKLPQYSKNQKILANFMLENLQTIPLLSVQEVAGKAGVSTASVVRFARILGFEGYLDFRNQLMELLKEQLSPLQKYKKTLSQKEEFHDTLNKVSQTVLDNINYTIQNNDLNKFKHIIQHLKEADTVYCLGMGISHYLAEIMAYLLKLFMKKAFALHFNSPSFPEQIALMAPKDLLIVFSFPPYSRQTVEAAEQAKKQGSMVISFTDRQTAPVIEFSEHFLIARTDNILFTNSLGAISVLMNAIVTEMALTEESKMLEGLQKTESYLNDPRYYYL